MSSVNVKSTHNDPVVGLMAQATQLKSQTAEHAKYDLNVTSFDGNKTNKDEEMKLYIPVETYTNYTDRKKHEQEIINLLFVAAVLFIIFAIAFRNK